MGGAISKRAAVTHADAASHSPDTAAVASSAVAVQESANQEPLQAEYAMNAQAGHHAQAGQLPADPGSRISFFTATVEVGASDSTEGSEMAPAAPPKTVNTFRTWYIGPADIDVLKKDGADDWKLGEGSRGTVYKARLRATGKEVAVKMLVFKDGPALNIADFMAQYETIPEMKSDSLLAVIGGCDDTDCPSLVSEFASCGNLRTAYRENQSLMAWHRQGLRLCLQVAKGLQALHKRQPPLIHQVLHSGNVLVMEGCTVAKIDMTMAYFSDAWAAFTAPERLSQGQQLTEKVDIYSLGALLEEVISQKPPTRGERAVLPPSLPPPLLHLVASCTNANPERRPQAQQVVMELNDIIHSYCQMTFMDKEDLAREQEDIARLQQALSSSSKHPAPADGDGEPSRPHSPPAANPQAEPPMPLGGPPATLQIKPPTQPYGGAALEDELLVLSPAASHRQLPVIKNVDPGGGFMPLGDEVEVGPAASFEMEMDKLLAEAEPLAAKNRTLSGLEDMLAADELDLDDFMERLGAPDPTAGQNPSREAVPGPSSSRTSDNVNCKMCTDCSSCRDCSGCVSCANCRNCRTCDHCTDCANCDNCDNCTGCSDCKNCDNCVNCSGLRNMSGCVDIHM